MSSPAITVDSLKAHEYGMLIDGEIVESIAKGRRPAVDPSSGGVVTTFPEATAADVDRAVASAQRARENWEAMGVSGRADCFTHFDQLIRDNTERLAMLDALDCGNPVTAMRADIEMTHEYINGWPALMKARTGQRYPGSPGNLHYSADRPYGVVGRITAFNHPAMFAITRPLPSLMAGNTIVIKPSEETSLSTLALGEIFNEAFPPGVVNVVTGGAAVGDAIVTHDAIKRLAFTGSIGTGLMIQRRAAESGRVKHVSLELGGKNAMIVFPDVDVEEAAAGAVRGMSFNICQGQACGSNSRILVHAKVYDEFVSRVSALIASYRVGVAYDETTDVGPLVSAAHWERVSGFVDSGVSEGASLVRGGERPKGLPTAGNFLEPTLFADVDPSMRIAREEIFGPVMSVFVWDDYDTMMGIANGLDLGLTASVWTNDLSVAHKTAEALEAGYVWINDASRHYFGTPFGGHKDSSLGREESAEELQSFLEQKVIHTRLASPQDAYRRMMERI